MLWTAEHADKYKVRIARVAAGEAQLEGTVAWLMGLGMKQDEAHTDVLHQLAELKVFDSHERRDSHGRWAKRPGADISDSVSLSDSFSVAIDDPVAREDAKQIIDEVSAIHGYPAGTHVTRVVRDPELPPGILASYDPTFETMHVAPSDKIASHVVIHEMGHKLDNALGGSNAYVTEDAPMVPSRRKALVQDVMDSINASNARKVLMRGPLGGEDKFERTLGGRPYWSSPSEIFARAYSQYMEKRLGISKYPEYYQHVALGVQWNEEDFKPIYTAFDNLLNGTHLASEQKAFDPNEPRDSHGRWTNELGHGLHPPPVINDARNDPDPESRRLALEILRAEETVRRMEQHRDHQPERHRDLFQRGVDEWQVKLRETYARWVARQHELGRKPPAKAFDSNERRDDRGRWVDSPELRDFAALQNVLGGMGALDMEVDPEHRPDLFMKHPKSGFTVRNDKPAPKIINRLPAQYGRGEFPMIADTVPGPAGIGDQEVPGSRRPLPFAFRAISEADYQQALRNGYLKSDQRMNLSQDEGTVAEVGDPSFYLPGKLASDTDGDYPGRIVKIALRPQDGWTYDRDGYIKTRQSIPIDQLTGVSPLIVTEKRDGRTHTHLKGYHESEHPRDWRGRWRDQTTRIGVTPFRPQDTIEGFRDTPKYHEFLKLIDSTADHFGIKVGDRVENEGIWQDGQEPSVDLGAHGDGRAIQGFGATLGKAYEQDAVAFFAEDDNGEDVRWRLSGITDWDKARDLAAKRLGFANLSPSKDRLEFWDQGAKDSDKVAELARELDAEVEFTFGRFTLIERDGYDEAIRRAESVLGQEGRKSDARPGGPEGGDTHRSRGPPVEVQAQEGLSFNVSSGGDAELKFDPHQPRDDHGRWSRLPGGNVIVPPPTLDESVDDRIERIINGAGVNRSNRLVVSQDRDGNRGRFELGTITRESSGSGWTATTNVDTTHHYASQRGAIRGLILLHVRGGNPASTRPTLSAPTIREARNPREQEAISRAEREGLFASLSFKPNPAVLVQKYRLDDLGIKTELPDPSRSLVSENAWKEFADGVEKIAKRFPFLVDKDAPYHVTELHPTSGASAKAHRVAYDFRQAQPVAATSRPRGGREVSELYFGDLTGDTHGIGSHEKGGILAAASGESYVGVAVHEMGHAFGFATGALENNDAVSLMVDNGLSYGDLAKISHYAAAQPLEGFAELFAMYYTDDKYRKQLDPEVARKAGRMFTSLESRAKTRLETMKELTGAGVTT